jgi:predicted signal transduction protein with EAL and GGDEF domain
VSPPNGAEPQAPGAWSGAPAHILLVADAAACDAWSVALRALSGTEVVAAHDLAAAAKQWTRKPADLVLVHAGIAGGAVPALAHLRSKSRLRPLTALVVHDVVEPDAAGAFVRECLRAGAVSCLGPRATADDVALATTNLLNRTTLPWHRSRIDAITGLPEREALVDEMIWVLADAQRGGSIGAVLHIDLDRFEQISEALGRGFGERLLRGTARRLGTRLADLQREMVTGPIRLAGSRRDRKDEGSESAVGGEPMLARVGPASLVVLLPRVDSAFAAETAARQLLQTIAEPHMVAGHEVVLGAHAGISVFPHDGLETETLLKRAATAARHAREDGEGPCQFYRSDLNARTLRRLGMESELRRTVERGELELFFQPKAHVKTGLLTGAEALLRWNRPGHGLVSPAEFVPLAEETGLILPLGQWVLDAACRQIRLWQVEGMRVPRISFNASALQLRSPQFVPAVMRTMRDVGIDGSCLTLEVTETAVMSNTRDAIRLLQVLKRTGARISIDDFGTGYSSLSYLRRLPVDEIKIDRSFLSDVEHGGEGAVVAAAIISMGHSLGYKVVAEGVENDAQLDFLRDHGCDEFQGFLLSQPLPAGTFGEVIAGALADSAVQSHTA